jgi:TPR repeat protein
VRFGKWARSKRAYRKAAQAGDTEAMYQLAMKLQRESATVPEALMWYRRAAESGHISAMNMLGGTLFARKELAEAESWLRRAAEAGSADAAYNLARVLLDCGNATGAEVWFQRAMDGGVPESHVRFAFRTAFVRGERTNDA